jgi:hypothetical protein
LFILGVGTIFEYSLSNQKTKEAKKWSMKR